MPSGRPRQPAEEQTEHKHHEQRLDDRPRRPERGLLVAHLDIAPGQEIEQLAILRKLAEPDRSTWAAQS